MSFVVLNNLCYWTCRPNDWMNGLKCCSPVLFHLIQRFSWQHFFIFESTSCFRFKTSSNLNYLVGGSPWSKPAQTQGQRSFSLPDAEGLLFLLYVSCVHLPGWVWWNMTFNSFGSSSACSWSKASCMFLDFETARSYFYLASSVFSLQF